VHPQVEQEVKILEHIFGRRGRFGAWERLLVAVLACNLRTATRKRSSTFFEEKMHPEKILATPMQERPGRDVGLATRPKSRSTPYIVAGFVWSFEYIVAGHGLKFVIPSDNRCDSSRTKVHSGDKIYQKRPEEDISLLSVPWL